MGNGDKITHAKFQVSILKIFGRDEFLKKIKKLILLRKGPRKIFPHHFFSCGPVIIWMCWCEKKTWKIEKSSISSFYDFFFRPKTVFDQKNIELFFFKTYTNILWKRNKKIGKYTFATFFYFSLIFFASTRSNDYGSTWKKRGVENFLGTFS